MSSLKSSSMFMPQYGRFFLSIGVWAWIKVQLSVFKKIAELPTSNGGTYILCSYSMISRFRHFSEIRTTQIWEYSFFKNYSLTLNSWGFCSMYSSQLSKMRSIESLLSASFCWAVSELNPTESELKSKNSSVFLVY